MTRKKQLLCFAMAIGCVIAALINLGAQNTSAWIAFTVSAVSFTYSGYCISEFRALAKASNLMDH